MEVYANLRKHGSYVLLSICDIDILGKTLRKGKIVFNVREEFYEGPKVSLEEALDMIEQSTIVNMVGKGIISKAIEKGLLHPDAVLEIDGVPHAQVLRA